MSKEFLEIIKIADIHANRIQMALDELAGSLPFDHKKISHLEKQNLLWVELLVSRFGKLQDLLGAKIIDAFLLAKEENIDKLTMLDKIHKLERLGIIEDVELWKEMRIARNHVAHEYPEHPELTAVYINKIIELAPKLLAILNKVKEAL